MLPDDRMFDISKQEMFVFNLTIDMTTYAINCIAI